MASRGSAPAALAYGPGLPKAPWEGIADVTHCCTCGIRAHAGPGLIGWATLVQAAPQVASVESPGKVLKVSLVLDGGTARYRVERLGDTVVEDSKLGFALRDGRLTAISLCWASSGAASMTPGSSRGANAGSPATISTS